MTPSRWGGLLVLGALGGLAGCSDDPAPPKTSVSWHFGPPEGSVQVGFPADPEHAKEKLLVASVTQSGFSVDGSTVRWGASIMRWSVTLVCDPDFGCKNTWSTVPDTLCFTLAGTAATQVDAAQCAPLLAPFRAATLPDLAQEQLGRRLGSWGVGVSSAAGGAPLGGVAISPTEWLGEYHLLATSEQVYPGYAGGTAPGAGAPWSRQVVVRASLLPDGGVGQPNLEVAPDNDPFLERLYRNLRDGKAELGFHIRDGAAIGLSDEPGPLSGQVLSPVTSRVAPGVSGMVIGGQAFTVYTSVRDRLLGDIQEVNDNDTGDILDFWVFAQGAPTAPPGLLQALVPLHSEADAPDVGRVCFGMQLDPSTLTTAAVTVEGAHLKRVGPTPDGECVELFVDALPPGTAVTATLTGLKSAGGVAMAGPERVGLYFGRVLPDALLSGGAPLPDGSLALGDELLTSGLHSFTFGFAQNLHVLTTFADPSGPGAWVALAPELGHASGNSQGYQRLDSAANVYVPLAGQGGFALGDGSLLAATPGGEAFWLKPDGTQAPASPALFSHAGVALGSPDLWVATAADPTHLERRTPAGAVVDTFAAPKAVYTATSAATQGTTWLCSNAGLFRKDGAAWTLQRPECRGVGPAPGGTFLAAIPDARTGQTTEVVRLKGATLAPFTRPDPLPGSVATHLIERVDAFEGRVYVTVTGGGLRMISLEQWTRVEQGLSP